MVVFQLNLEFQVVLQLTLYCNVKKFRPCVTPYEVAQMLES